MQRKRVAVFCGSRNGIDTSWLILAHRFGNVLAGEGYDLVWGGCDVSMMGALGRGVQEFGGRVHAIIPASIVKGGLAFSGADSLLQVANLGERKQAMKEGADAFVALPGGFGTLDELFDVVAEQHIFHKDGLPTKPIVILNAGGLYNPLVSLLDQLYATGMAGADYRQLYSVENTIPRVMKRLKVIQ